MPASRPAEPVVHTLTATPDPPPTGIANPIHADDGASGAGYRAALVAGVRTYGWVAEAVVEALGRHWLDHGWADITLRRPLYAGELVTVTVAPTDAEDGHWNVKAAVDDRVVLDGSAGSDAAVWLDELDPPEPRDAEDAPEVRPTYTLDDVPLGRSFRPLGAYVSADAARRLATDDLGQSDSLVPPTRLHPWFLAARMAPLTRHNYTYGPTIHVRTQIQHQGPAYADQQVVVGARIIDAFERKGHSYQVLDGIVTGTGHAELARIRHHTIFRPRTPAPS